MLVLDLYLNASISITICCRFIRRSGAVQQSILTKYLWYFLSQPMKQQGPSGAGTQSRETSA
jgi:hypothetical protein